jgi:hypothetical protein
MRYDESSVALYRFFCDYLDAIMTSNFNQTSRLYQIAGLFTLSLMILFLSAGNPNRTVSADSVRRSSQELRDELWVTSSSPSQIKRYGFATGGLLDTYTGCGGVFDVHPAADGYFYVTCSQTNQIRKLNSQGADLGPIIFEGLCAPYDSTTGPDGNLYVVNSCGGGNGQGQVLRYTFSGQYIGVFIDQIAGSPHRLEFGANNMLAVGRFSDSSVNLYNATTGGYLRTINGGLSELGDLTFRNGELYILSSSGVKRFNPTTGALIGNFLSGGPSLVSPRGFEFGGNGVLYVTDALYGTVLRYQASTGVFIDTFISGAGWLGDLTLVSAYPAPTATPSITPGGPTLTATQTLTPLDHAHAVYHRDAFQNPYPLCHTYLRYSARHRVLVGSPFWYSAICDGWTSIGDISRLCTGGKAGTSTRWNGAIRMFRKR